MKRKNIEKFLIFKNSLIDQKSIQNIPFYKKIRCLNIHMAEICQPIRLNEQYSLTILYIAEYFCHMTWEYFVLHDQDNRSLLLNVDKDLY